MGFNFGAIIYMESAMKCKKLINFEIGISSNLLLNITLLCLNTTSAETFPFTSSEMYATFRN